MRLSVNKRKIKYMLLTRRDVRRIDSQITADNYTFKTVKKFVYLGSAITTKNDVSLEIKRRITLVNRCYYGLNGLLSSRDLSRTTKLIHYNTHPTRVSLWRRGMDAIKQQCNSLASIREKSPT